MQSVSWPVTVNNYRGYLLKSIKRDIAQHKWKDVLELLPCLLNVGRFNSDSYFVWKIIHCLMINLQFPLKVQEGLLHSYQQHIGDPHIVHLEWIFYSFHIPKNSVKDVFQFIEKLELKGKEGNPKLSTLQCFAYFKLHNYYEWLLKLKKYGASNEILEEGQHIYYSLEECYTNLLNYSPSMDKITKNEYDISSPKVCEWLLGPMLDIKKRMVSLQNIEPNETNDLILLDAYIKNAGNHIPALVLCAKYITACHPHRKAARAQLLQRICLLSPSDPMVIHYVEFFRKKSSNALREAFKYEETDIDFDSDIEFGDESTELGRTPAKESCQINGLSVTVTMHCIQTLLNMLEYPEWQNDLQPWTMLTNLLSKLYHSWVRCYCCHSCCQSRQKLKKILQNLALWPIHFWRIKLPANSTSTQAMVTMHRAFSAYVLGYDKQAGRDATSDLYSQGHHEVQKSLTKLISLRGEYESKVRKYLQSNRKLISQLQLYPDDIQIVDKTGDPFRLQVAVDDSSPEVVVLSRKRKRDC